jgi:hypothetical protein
MRSHPVLLVVVASLLAGCYNYLPLSQSHLTPSTYVAVTLTESGSEELAPYVGPSVVVVRGRIVGPTDRGLALSVASVETRRGNILEWQGELVVVPGEFVRAIEERRAARGKTVLLAGVSLVGFFTAYAAFGPGADGTALAGGSGGSVPR